MPAPHRINEQVTASEVRLFDIDGRHLGVKPLQEALALAVQRGLDLVEVDPDAMPPVCRIMDYGLFRSG